MVLPNLFSRRKRQREASGQQEVYRYDDLPATLRVQLTLLWDHALSWGDSNSDYDETLVAVVNLFRREVGTYQLAKVQGYHSFRAELYNWFHLADVDSCLDLIELTCRLLRERDYSGDDDAIAEINARMREHGVGYQFEGSEIVRVDSRFVHAEVVKPLLSLLAGPDYEAANKEFLEAHRFYRSGDGEQALVECCKAFESTLHVVAAKRRWTVPPNATAKPLLDAAFDNGLVPEYLRGEFNALRALLAEAVPTVRNKSAGHGAGTSRRTVPPHLVAFQLHQTAAAMLFLIEAEKVAA